MPDKLISAPIIPALPELETSKDPLAHINSPMPIVSPVIPMGSPDNIDRNEQLQGDFHTGPLPGAHPDKIAKNGTLDFVKAAVAQMHDSANVEDKFKYARTTSYGAGYKNMNFERYYKHPQFGKLGFSPYRDNETHYNENSSWWDDFNRMRGEWGGLVAGGFGSVWGSEEKANEIMEKGMSIGSSSRGGAGGWITNFGLNTAYTTGIMAEMALENVALAGITMATFGTAAPETGAVAAARTALSFGRLTKAWNTTTKFMEGLRAAENAKSFWKAAKFGEGVKDFAKWANPLQPSMDLATHLAKGSGGTKNLTNLAKASQAFGTFYKDIRELNLAHSEARLEGEGAARQYQEQLLDDYYAEHGYVAEGKDAEDIFNRAQALKGTVTLANDLTIYFTNKLVFQDLLKPVSRASRLEKVVAGSGKIGKITKAGAYKTGKNLIDVAAKTGIRDVGETLLKSQYAPWSRQYLVGNISEGLQESLQESIVSGSMAYYDAIHSDPLQSNYYASLTAIGKGLGEQFSAQGLDTFLSGYLMGSVIQGAQKGALSIADYVKSKAMGTQTQAQQEKEAAAKQTDDITNAVNHLAKNSLVYGQGEVTVDLATAMKQANERRTKSEEAGDVKGAYDASEELQINNLELLARTNNTDMVVDHVKDMLSLDDKSLAEAYEMSEDQAPEIRKRLQNFSNRVEGYKRKYDAAHKEKPNPFNPWMFAAKDKNGNLKYEDAYNREMAGYQAHEAALSDVIFATEAHESAAKRMQSIGNNLSGIGNSLKDLIKVTRAGTPVANAAGSDVSILIDHIQRGMTLKSLDDQISVLSTGTSEQRKQAEDLIKQRDLLKEWNGAAEHFYQMYRNSSLGKISPEQRAKNIQYARVRAGAVVKDKKTGLEYTVVSTKGKKATVRNSKGETKDINRSNLDTLIDAKGKRAEFEKVEGDDLSFAQSELYDVFDKYLRHVAKMKKGYVFDNDLQEAFAQTRDYIALELDSTQMVNTINRLSNPEAFQQYADIQAQINKLKAERRVENLKKAMQSFEKMSKTNEFIKALFDLGVFVLPEDVDKLKNFNMVNFYDQARKELVPHNSELYKKILDVVEKYAQAAGKQTTGKPIPESGTYRDPERDRHSGKARPKLDNDKRTYADYAEQFGFDPDGATSTVQTSKVLQAIIDSEYATPEEKVLARRLLTTVAEDRVITFVTNSNLAGYYASATNVTAVDARYTSVDYAGGKDGHPIEFVILHEYMHELTVKGLKTDTTFKNKVEELRAKAKAFQETDAFKKEFGNKPLYGTMNADEFVVESLTNPVFQKLLASIPIETPQGIVSGWEDFVNAVRQLMSTLLGVKADSTVLDEAVYIITAKLTALEEQRAKTGEKETTGPETLTDTQPVKITTPLNLIRDKTPELFDELIEGFKKYSKEVLDKEPTTNITEMTASDDWFKFMTSSKAPAIINAYNKRSGRTPGQPIKTGKPKVKGRWAVGNRWLLTARSLNPDGTYTEFVDTPIEVMPSEQSEGNDIIVKNLNTGERFLIDLDDQLPTFSTEAIEEPVVQVGEQVEETNTEAKKADIERRRQEELFDILGDKKSFEKIKDLTSVPITEEIAQTIYERFNKGEDVVKLTFENGSIESDGKGIFVIYNKGKDGYTNPFRLSIATKTMSYQGSRKEMSTPTALGLPIIPKNYQGDNVDTATRKSSQTRFKEINAKYDAELAALEQPIPTVYKDIPVKEQSGIKSNEGTLTAAKYVSNAKGSYILVDRVLLKEKYEQKAWTKPRKLKDGSSATPLPENTFLSYEQWENFVIEHEFQHSVTTRGAYQSNNPNSTLGEYETYINNQALEVLGLKKSKEDVDKGRESYDVLEEAYNQIDNKSKLDQWDERAIASIGVEDFFDGAFIRKMVEEKKAELAENLNFAELKEGDTLLMENNQIKVILKKTDKVITVVNLKDAAINPESGQVVLVNSSAQKAHIAKDNLKNSVKMKNGEFAEYVKGAPSLSEEQIKESDDAKKASAEDDVASAKEALDKASDKSDDDIDDDFMNNLKACNI